MYFTSGNDREEKDETTGGLIVLLFVLLAGGGAARHYFKFRKPKQSVKGSNDLDEYEFDDEEPVKEDKYGTDGDTPKHEKEGEE